MSLLSYCLLFSRRVEGNYPCILHKEFSSPIQILSSSDVP